MIQNKDFSLPLFVAKYLLGSMLLLMSLGVWTAVPIVVRNNYFVDQSTESLNYKGDVLPLILENSKSKYGPYVMQNGSQIDGSQSKLLHVRRPPPPKASPLARRELGHSLFTSSFQ